MEAGLGGYGGALRTACAVDAIQEFECDKEDKKNGSKVRVVDELRRGRREQEVYLKLGGLAVSMIPAELRPHDKPRLQHLRVAVVLPRHEIMINSS